jgi:hypothetical protein
MNSQLGSVSTRSVLDGGSALATCACAPAPRLDHRWAARHRIDTAATTAGAPLKSVTPSASMRRRISSPSIFRMITWRAPMAVSAYGMPQPLQWKVGRVCRYTSRSLTPTCHPKTTALSHEPRCVSWTPLGRAVVPEV